MRRTPFAAAWVAVGLALLAAWWVGLSGAFDRAVHDRLLRATRRAYDGPVVLVVIDQPSLRELAGWPWPRSRHAALVDRLTAAGATVIGLDIDFSTPSTPAEDAALVRAVRRSGRVVLIASSETHRLPGGLALEYASLPLPTLAEVAAGVGSSLVPLDADGVVRRATLRHLINAEPLPVFGLEIARIHAGSSAEAVAARAPDPRQVIIDFAAGAPPVHGYGDVLAGRVPDSAFAGRAVLVGASALELQDLRATPVGPLTPGVQVQGQLADTLLRGGGLRPIGTPSAAAAALVLALPALALARGRGRAVGVAVALGPLPVGLAAAAIGATSAGLFLPVGPFVTVGLAAALAHAAAEWAEARLEVGRVRRRLHALADFGRRAQAASGLEQSVETVLDIVRDLLGLDRLSVVLPDGRVIRPAIAAADAGLAEVVVPIAGGGGDDGRLVAALPRGRSLSAEEQALLEAIAGRIAVDSENRSLSADLQAIHLSVVHSLAVAIEMRNAYTGQHCEGVARRAAAVARAFGLDGDAVERIRLGGLLHDIGKIGVPEPILLKPGRFTPEEYEVMKQHSAIGHRIIASLPFAEDVKDYVRHHHERVDGSGYPDGLAGEAISVGARIVAVADCYEALTTDRPYRARVSPSDAMAYIRSHGGTFYDPAVVARLEEVLLAEGEDLDGPVTVDAPWHR